MNVILFGPPGAGKGTQSALLTERLNLRHISTGDLFREAMKNHTPLGLQAKEFVDAGKLVPDSIVIGMVEEVVSKLNGQGLILDGFPRTVPQAKALEVLLKRYGLSVGKAVFLEVPREQLLTRLAGRRVCQKCGAVFHVATKPTRRAGVCDVCGGQVVQRKDDFEDVILTRLEAYDLSTAPLKDYYGVSGQLAKVDGTGDTESVFYRVRAQIA